MVAVTEVGKRGEKMSMATIAPLGGLSPQSLGTFCFMGGRMRVLSVPSESRKG